MFITLGIATAEYTGAEVRNNFDVSGSAMRPSIAKPAAPSQDKRWKIVDATMRRVGQQSRGLIETLHTVQEAFGYLNETGLRYVAMSLRVPLSRAYGVATFYHFFTLKPAGEHTCVICMGTACYIKGAPQLVNTRSEEHTSELQ